MKRLILFEHLKFWRSRKNTAVLLIFIAALIGMVLFNTAKDKTYWQGQEDYLRYEQTLIKNEIALLEAELNSDQRGNSEDAAGEDEQLKGLYKLYREQYLLNYRQQIMAKDYSKGKVGVQERVALWIERDQHLLKGLQAGHNFLEESIVHVNQRLAMNQYLVQEGIEPLSSPYQMTATNFIYQLTDYPWILTILIALALLNIDMFSGDVEGGAYKVLYSQPYRRSRIHAVKFSVHFLNSFAAVALIVLAMFGVMAMSNGLGDIHYPTYYYSESYQALQVISSESAIDSFTFLPWSEYMLKTVPLYFLLCCFIISLIGTASLLLNNTTNGLNILFCLLVLDFISRSLFAKDSGFIMFWPFTASALNSVLKGLYSLSASAYLIWLSVLTVLLFAGSLAILRKRDLTGGISE